MAGRLARRERVSLPEYLNIAEGQTAKRERLHHRVRREEPRRSQCRKSGRFIKTSWEISPTRGYWFSNGTFC